MSPLAFGVAMTLIGALFALDLLLWLRVRRLERERKVRLRLLAQQRGPSRPKDAAWYECADGWSPR